MRHFPALVHRFFLNVKWFIHAQTDGCKIFVRFIIVWTLTQLGLVQRVLW